MFANDRLLRALTFAIFVAANGCGDTAQLASEQASLYASASYDGFVRSSQYVTVRDGTRIAVDVFRPSTAGDVETAPLPVLFMQTQYRRAWYDELGGETYMPAVFGDFLELVKFGYVVICADARGEGASFGSRRGPWSLEEILDAHDVIEWSADQAWSTGKVGMFGLSYMGGIQLLAAASKPPHLVAIFPGLAPFSQFDVHQTVVPAEGPFPEPGDPSDSCFFGQCDSRTIPVDADLASHELLKSAIAQHRMNQTVGPLPYRDSISQTLGVPYFSEASPASYTAAIAASNVAIYMYTDKNNWLSQGSILNYVNASVPHKKLLVLGADASFDLIGEHVRWFDAMLKGIDNGILSEPPISYRTTGDTAELYRSSSSWPPVMAAPTDFYFSEHELTNIAPKLNGTSDQMSQVLGLEYTGQPLAADTEVTGYPIIHLWVSVAAADGDFTAWLQEVDVWGNVTGVVDPIQGPAKLRASLRSLGAPPYDNLGLPWHPGFQADEQKLTGEPVELVFDMLFVSHIFKRGNRIRVAITGPDAAVHREALMPSRILLPIVRSD